MTNHWSVQNYLIQKPFGSNAHKHTHTHSNANVIAIVLNLFRCCCRCLLLLKFYLICANDENENKLISLCLFFCFFFDETKGATNPISEKNAKQTINWRNPSHFFLVANVNHHFSNHTKFKQSSSSSSSLQKHTHALNLIKTTLILFTKM